MRDKRAIILMWAALAILLAFPASAQKAGETVQPEFLNTWFTGTPTPANFASLAASFSSGTVENGATDGTHTLQWASIALPVAPARYTPVPPTAAFGASALSGTAPLNVQFTDESEGAFSDIVSYSWDFGDNSAANITASPAHAYTSAGTFTATLTVQDEFGSATATKTITVQYSLATATSGSGTVALNPPGGAYDNNTSVQATATPAAGWRFDHWTGDLSGNTNPASVTMSAAKSVTAVFIQQFTLATAASPDNAGAVSGAGTYDTGTSVPVTGTASSGWRFDHWTGDLSGNTNPASVTMSAAKSVTAVFIQQFILATASSPDNAGTVSGAGTYPSVK